MKHVLQPIQALEHQAFKEMISVAARSTRGVVIPNRKATRVYIIKLFKKNLTNLREQINVSVTYAVVLLQPTFYLETEDWPRVPDLRCMASRQSRCLFRSHRALE